MGNTWINNIDMLIPSIALSVGANHYIDSNILLALILGTLAGIPAFLYLLIGAEAEGIKANTKIFEVRHLDITDVRTVTRRADWDRTHLAEYQVYYKITQDTPETYTAGNMTHFTQKTQRTHEGIESVLYYMPWAGAFAGEADQKKLKSTLSYWIRRAIPRLTGKSIEIVLVVYTGVQVPSFSDTRKEGLKSTLQLNAGGAV